MKTKVWDREGEDEVGKRMFVFQITTWTIVGIGATLLASLYSRNWELTWPFLIVACVVSLWAAWNAGACTDMGMLLIYFAAITIPLGLLLGPTMALYDQVSIMNALFITTTLVVALAIVGIMNPNSLEHWGIWLLGGLIILIAGYFIIPLGGFVGLPVTKTLGIWDWIAIFIFSALVIYDWNRAMRIPRTQVNALSCAVAVYLDFLNLFIRILRKR